MQLYEVVLALAALALVPSEGSENRAATGLASKVAGLLRGKCTEIMENCVKDSDCCTGQCRPFKEEHNQYICF